MEDRRNFSGGNGWGFINILEWDSQGFSFKVGHWEFL